MVSKTTLHAVKALAVLARLAPGDHAGAGQVAQEIDAPPNYLGKLLQTLAREGLVQSQKGLGGGFRLAKPADQITLLDVAEPLEQVSRWTGCFMGRAKCGDEPCAVHERWAHVRDAYFALLTETTIADLVENEPAQV